MGGGTGTTQETLQGAAGGVAAQGVGKVFDFAGAQALDVVDCGVLQHLGGRAGHLLAGGQGQGGHDGVAGAAQFPGGGVLDALL